MFPRAVSDSLKKRRLMASPFTVESAIISEHSREQFLSERIWSSQMLLSHPVLLSFLAVLLGRQMIKHDNF